MGIVYVNPAAQIMGSLIKVDPRVIITNSVGLQRAGACNAQSVIGVGDEA